MFETQPHPPIYAEAVAFYNSLIVMKPKTKMNDKNGWHLHPLMWVVVALTAASVGIFVTGLLIPPAGEVHPSVLKGLAILTADIALVIFAYAVVSGKTATFRHGNTSATVGGTKKRAQNDEPTE